MILREPVYLYFLGTAGCGKSTLTGAFSSWLDQMDVSNQVVNLDPGADSVPYEPDVDIREWVTLQEVMKEYGLGPNGAQIVTADMLALQLPHVKKALEGSSPSVVLVDTPGQLELFTFRESTRHIIENLSGRRSLLVYIVDPFNARTATGLTSQMVLASLCHFRFSVPFTMVLSKADLVERRELDRILHISSSPEVLYEALLSEVRGSPSMEKEYALDLYRTLEDLGLFGTLKPLSAQTGEGLEMIYKVYTDIFLGGEEEVELPDEFNPVI
ncbi:MAG TPA: GTPase [Euryarchaeota archaeon]|nr:MAG: GTPase [Thermoplasmata archaeon]HDD59327.1 GTPase [Euryarchaeota archaeon]